jgi:hypothetical protein
MPIVRFDFNGLVGGTLLALLCGSINPASAQPASPTAASSFSGTYKGTTSLAGDRQAVVAEAGPMRYEPLGQAAGNDGSCQPGGPVSFEVRDGRFKFAWNEPQAFDVKISSDGSFYAASPNALSKSDKRMMIVPIMQGRVTATSLVADYGTRWCHYRLEATRS